MSTRRRRRGRRWIDPDEAERMKHIRCTALLLSRKYTPEGVAALHGVSVRTVYRWRDLALGYDDPEAEGLRRLAGKVTS
jgi:transposase-like protein